MHGRVACEERKKDRRHMWTAPSRAIPLGVRAVVGSSSSLSVCSSNSFLKDGRKISVGDCALFKPSQDCPPFIGIIRTLTARKENQLKLGVNWLYRPAEVKLGKGILLEAAPNELFYSFHEDEILAASLLHPCKVAFLPKGVELPSGICSFVCRRVYDITNKCLWWLTDQDYIDERQEEVDQLLNKTRSEMHATDGRSPKPMNGPTPTSQLKQSSDGVQNSGSSFPSSQVKGKKRERIDQGSEPVKRERFARIDDGDSGYGRLDSTLKSEIAKITEKGGLVDSDGVEKLVQLMSHERNEKKVDLVSRSMLVGVVAATDKFDCLSRFVQLRGLPVFDEWLQEVHKGKIGDGNSSKDGDKSTEEFLLVLLRALDKLPVNLHALQMCNIGKSVNHLRTHKNLEIQRKARSLVDTWKKRVEAEMDAKSGSGQGVSWPARSRLPEASHGGSMKTSVTHSNASKSPSFRLMQGENNTKSASPSPGSTKSGPSLASGSTNVKDGQPKNAAAGGVHDIPLTTARDDKSSSSSQCSSDHAKSGGPSGKEDARSSTAVSMNVTKKSGGSSRHRKSVNGFQGSAPSAVQRETGPIRSSSFQRNNAATEKLSQSTLTSEKTPDVPVAEGTGQKLIVKIPNRGRSPAQSASAGSIEEAAVMNSRASSPVLSEKNDQVDHNLKGKTDTYGANISSDVNAESWQSSDFKDVMTGSDEGGGSSSVPYEEHRRTIDDASKVALVSKAASPSSANEPMSGKWHDGSFSSINALIESCVKYSEVNVSMAVEDDGGMDLLASVAAGEISKSDMVSPTASPVANENSCVRSGGQPTHGAEAGNEEQHVVTGAMWSKDAENRTSSKPVGEVGGSLDSTAKDLKQVVKINQCLESSGKSNVVVIATATLPSGSDMEKNLDDDGSKELKNVKIEGITDAHDVSDAKHKVESSSTEPKADPGLKVENEAPEESLAHPSLESDSSNKKEQKPPGMIGASEFVGRAVEVALHPSGSGKDMVLGNVDELKSEKSDGIDVSNHFNPTEQKKTEGDSATDGNQVVSVLDSSVTNHKVDHVEENLGDKEVNKSTPSEQVPPKASTSFPLKETNQHSKPRELRLASGEADQAEESNSITGNTTSVSAAGGSDTDAKVEFDLNEGFGGDDGRNGDLNNMAGPESSKPVQLVSLLPLHTPSPISGALPASITVAAAAKGPFVPPEDLLRNKGSHGWKGSAATSAFRPAEPRKAPELPHSTNNIAPSYATPGKQTRPPLDIDLNIPDERILEDLASRSSCQVTSSVSDHTNDYDMLHEGRMGSGPVRSAGGLDLDLNRVDEHTDMGNYPSNSHRMEASFQPVKPLSSGRIGNETGARRDFDLNNGLAADEVNSEPSTMIGQHARSGMLSQSPLSGIRLNGGDVGNFSSWFPAANTYSQVTIPPSILHDRGDQPFPIVASGGPQRMLGPTTGTSPFSTDVFRDPVLSSSPAVPFQSTPFQYPVFPFGTSFPLPSATFSVGSATYVDSSSGGRLCFPPVNSQLVGPAVTLPSNYARPYVVSVTDGSNKGGSESGRKWFRQDLDLNAGPGVPEGEARNVVSSLAPRPLSASGSQALTEEQARIFQMSGGVLKRKEPEGGWDGYKQSSWQ